MAYSPEEIEDTFNEICQLIAYDGLSLRKCLEKENMPSSRTFFKWIKKDETKEKVKQYAGATSLRADHIFQECFDIADAYENDIKEDKDGNEIVNHNVIQRDRLRVDTRKWAAGKMNPKKYGEAQLIKLGDNEGGELKVNAIFNMDLLNVPTDDSPKEDS